MSDGGRPGAGWAIWLGAAALAVLVWLAAEATIRHLGEQARQNVLTSAALRASTAAADLERTLEGTAGPSILAQARALLEERGDAAGALALQRQLDALIRASAFGISELMIGDRDGRVTWSSNAPGSAGSLAGQPWFDRLRTGAVRIAIGLPRRTSGLDARREILVARPLVDAGGQFSGVAVTGLSLDALSRQLALPDPQEGGTAMLLRATPGPGGSSALSVLSAGPAGGPPRPPPPPELLRELTALAAARPDGSAILEIAASPQPLLAGWSRVDPAGLWVAFVTGANTALADTRREAAILRAVATALTLLIITGAYGLILLSARRRAAAALGAAESARAATEAARVELERLVASLPAMVYHGDLAADGTLTARYITANATRVMGWPPERLPPRDTFLAHVDPGLGHDVAAFFAGLLKGGPDTFEYRIARPDGSWVWLRHHARVVARHGSGGEIIGSLADITEERGLRAQAAISSQLAALGEMAGSIAHELNRPLAVMVMAAHNALATLDDEAPDRDELRARLDRIAAQGVRANRIIHHLQALSRPEGEAQEEISLPNAVEAALTLTGASLRQAHVTLDNRISPALPPALGQAIAIEQVLVNLLTNARDALLTRPADARHLSLGASSDDHHVIVEIADTGPGIPEAVLARIFEPFFTTKAPGQGTGLGLSICHAAMREMGGSITARNTPDGACFRLIFRRAKPPSGS